MYCTRSLRSRAFAALAVSLLPAAGSASLSCAGEAAKATSELPESFEVPAASPGVRIHEDTGFLATTTHVGPVRLCGQLSEVDSVWQEVTDTVVGSEGVEWPAKIVHFEKGTTLWFESSWSDYAVVWRASTDSPRFHTRRGVRVGIRLATMLDQGLQIDPLFHRGSLALWVWPDSVFVEVDSSAEARIVGNPTERTIRLVAESAVVTRVDFPGFCARRRGPF